MNNENNVTRENVNVPAQKDNGGKNGGKQPRARRDIKAEAAHVLAFLNSCTPYQADAVRVTVSHATGSGRYEDIDEADRLAVNRFLNHGMNKGNTPSTDAVMKFRVERSEVLMNSVTQFCTQSQILRATVALMRITTDAGDVRKAFEKLPDGK